MLSSAVLSLSPEVYYQMETNPVEKYIDLEETDADSGVIVIETMVNMTGQKVLNFESNVRQTFSNLYSAIDNDNCYGDIDSDSALCNAIV